MQEVFDKATVIAEKVVQDEDNFKQAKRVSQETVKYYAQQYKALQRGVLILAILLVLKAMVESIPQRKKH